MAAANFARVMPRILVYEGGWSNHPRDPGGVTLEGVIQRVYDGFRRACGRNLRPLTPAMRNTPEWIAERDAIYRRQYWNAVQGDRVPAGIDLVLMDGAVNSGPVLAIKWLQRALAAAGAYRGVVDGHLGESTIAAIEQHGDHDALIADTLARRLAFLKSLKTWSTFGTGWSRRLANVKAIAQGWAAGSVGPAPVAVADACGHCKASVADLKVPPLDDAAGTAAAGTGATVVTVLQGTQAQLEPLAASLPSIGPIVTTLSVIAALIGVAGIVYAWWAKRRAVHAAAAAEGELVADVDAHAEAA